MWSMFKMGAEDARARHQFRSKVRFWRGRKSVLAPLYFYGDYYQDEQIDRGSIGRSLRVGRHDDDVQDRLKEVVGARAKVDLPGKQSYGLMVKISYVWLNDPRDCVVGAHPR